MKRTFPLFITGIVGFVLIVSFFIPLFQEAGEVTAVWFDILASIAFILGGGNLLKVHLKKISDQAKGWGYSGVTIVAFLVTLFVGLFKVGSPPAVNTEFYGESFALLPVTSLPEYRLAGTIPSRTDGERLPASVRAQLRGVNNEVVFRGWMSEDQKEALINYLNTLEWRCLVERLYDEAQPPGDLRGKLAYYADHYSIAFKGYMSEEMEAQLADPEALKQGPLVQAAIAELAEQARHATTLEYESIPSGVADGANAAGEQIEVSKNQVIIRGPMTVAIRNQLANEWPGYARFRPLSESERAALLQQIQNLGPPLTDDPDTDLDQKGAFDKYLGSIWSVDMLHQALDLAGQPQEEPRTACAMLQDMRNGVADIKDKETVGQAVSLNAAQVAMLQQFVDDDNMTVDELSNRLSGAGEFTDNQQAALQTFIDRTPTVAEVRYNLAFELLRAGPLSKEQQEFLFADYRTQFAWRQAVGRLFLQSQEVKYPWSGEYNAQSTPFYWLYDYVFQPLTATMFAMLAFYVASAAFRAFRAKNVEAILLLGTAFLILLGRTFAGYWMTAWLPDWLSGLRIDQLTVYIMAVFNTAGNRAIMIGIALGIASTSLKVLLGVDRSYLGSGEE